MQFADGSSIGTVLDSASDHSILRFQDVSAGEIYDGMVLFREVTPMENVCPKSGHEAN